MFSSDFYNVYFVENGKKIEKDRINIRTGYYGERWNNDINIIEPQKFFNLEFDNECRKMTKYIINLIDIKEAYCLKQYENCLAVICKSLNDRVEN